MVLLLLLRILLLLQEGHAGRVIELDLRGWGQRWAERGRSGHEGDTGKIKHFGGALK